LDASLLSWPESDPGDFKFISIFGGSLGRYQKFLESFGLCFVGVGAWWGSIACLGLVGCWACMYSLMLDSPFAGRRRMAAPKKKTEERQDLWIEKLIRGLIAVARNVPQARVALYQLIRDLTLEIGR
jgi:hypothetical protein